MYVPTDTEKKIVFVETVRNKRITEVHAVLLKQEGGGRN